MSLPQVSSEAPSEFLVIGAGVLALSTASILQTKYPRTTITLVASEFPTASPMQQGQQGQQDIFESSSSPSPSYASMWAGAHYRPIPFILSSNETFSALQPSVRDFHLQLEREKAWAVATAERMKHFARSSPEAGVGIVPAEEYLESPPFENSVLKSGDMYAGSDDEFRVFGPVEIDTINEKVLHRNPNEEYSVSVSKDKSKGNDGETTGEVKWACSYQTYVVNVHVYCAYLLQQFAQRGGRKIQRKLKNLEEATQLLSSSSSEPRSRSIIVNCSGTGIVRDPNINIIRGQTVLVRNMFSKTITRQCEDGTWSFLIPRPGGGGTIVGGTKQIGDEEGKARPEERKVLLENAVKYFPNFVDSVDKFQVVCDNVGRRPARKGGVRIETELLKVDEQNSVSVIHGYGAGGRGYEISWGVAEEICGLVESCLTGSSGFKESESPATTAKL